MVLARRQSEVSHALHAKLVPWVAQILRLEELHLVGDTARAELLIRRVLQVPASLRLLHILADHCSLGTLRLVWQSLPDLQVLLSVALLVLARELPCNDVGAQRRESKLEDVDCRDGRNEVASRGIDHRNPRISLATDFVRELLKDLLFGRRPGKVPAVRRVAFTTKVAFRPMHQLAPCRTQTYSMHSRCEPGKSLVCGRRVEDPDALGGAIWQSALA